MLLWIKYSIIDFKTCNSNCNHNQLLGNASFMIMHSSYLRNHKYLWFIWGNTSWLHIRIRLTKGIKGITSLLSRYFNHRRILRISFDIRTENTRPLYDINLTEIYSYSKIYSVVYLNISVYLKNYLRYLLFWCDNLHYIYRWCMLCICYYVVAIFNVWQRWTTSKFFCINASFPV